MRIAAMATRPAQALLVLTVVHAVAPAARAGVHVVDGHYRLSTVVKDTAFAGANGATIGGDGALYVVHTGDGTTTRVDLKTMAATEFVHPYAGIFISDDITSDGKGTFYATGTTPLVGEVYRIDAAGMKTVIARGLTAPNGIQFNRKTGRLFVTECFQANRVFEIDPTGGKEPRLIVKADTIPVPEGFDFDPDTQDLIIPDMGSGRILRVNPDSGAIQPIADKFAAPIALKVGPDKKAYFPELGGAVYRLSLDGKTRDKLAQLPPGLDNLGDHRRRPAVHHQLLGRHGLRGRHRRQRQVQDPVPQGPQHADRRGGQERPGPGQRRDHDPHRAEGRVRADPAQRLGLRTACRSRSA